MAKPKKSSLDDLLDNMTAPIAKAGEQRASHLVFDEVLFDKTAAPLWTPNPENKPQCAAYDSQADVLGFGGSSGGGKALKLNTLIQTRSGLKAIGTIKVGDQVFDDTGFWCDVVAKSEVFTGHDCFDVSFDDGETITADAEHSWLVYRNGEESPRMVTTWRLVEEVQYRYLTVRNAFSMSSKTKTIVDRAIVSVKPVKSVPVQCIQVNSHNGVYLVGEGMIPTHNSDLILGLAVTRQKRCLVLRKEQVSGRGLMDRAREILGDRGRFNENLGVWQDRETGHSIEFGGLKDAGDEVKYKGRAHDFLAFDECDQISEFPVRFLQAWVRTTDPHQRCRVVLTFNPPSSAEGRWLLKFFAPWLDKRHHKPAVPGELRWFATLMDGKDVKEIECPNADPILQFNPALNRNEVITPRSRTFIPSGVRDNPYLLHNNSYISTLQSLPEPLRSQLLYGDFSAGQADDQMQVIPTAWAIAAQERWTEDGHGGEPLDKMGADISHGGKDSTILSRRRGRRWFDKLLQYQGEETDSGPKTAGLILQALYDEATGQKWPACTIHVDAIGFGSSTYDSLINMPSFQGMDVVPIDFGSGAPGMDRAGVLDFLNMRAWAWWALREALDPVKGDDLMLPPDQELLSDLTAPRWESRSGRIVIEDKKAIKKRIGRSPDRGDAVVLANIEMPSLSFQVYIG